MSKKGKKGLLSLDCREMRETASEFLTTRDTYAFLEFLAEQDYMDDEDFAIREELGFVPPFPKNGLPISRLAEYAGTCRHVQYTCGAVV